MCKPSQLLYLCLQSSPELSLWHLKWSDLCKSSFWVSEKNETELEADVYLCIRWNGFLWCSLGGAFTAQENKTLNTHSSVRTVGTEKDVRRLWICVTAKNTLLSWCSGVIIPLRAMLYYMISVSFFSLLSRSRWRTPACPRVLSAPCLQGGGKTWSLNLFPPRLSSWRTALRKFCGGFKNAVLRMCFCACGGKDCSWF